MAELFAKAVFTAHLAAALVADEFALLDASVTVALAVKAKFM